MSSVTIENLGLAGSMNSFARNLGMVIGISLSTTVLYQAMSAKMGQRVTNYIADRPDVFLYGMKITFLGSFVLCFVAFFLTIWRIKKQGGIQKNVWKTIVEEFLEACVWVSGISMDDGRWSELLKTEKLKYYLQNTSTQLDARFDYKKTAKATGNRKLGIHRWTTF